MHSPAHPSLYPKLTIPLPLSLVTFYPLMMFLSVLQGFHHSCVDAGFVKAMILTVVPQVHSTSFSETKSLTGLELLKQTGLAVQCVPCSAVSSAQCHIEPLLTWEF